MSMDDQPSAASFDAVLELGAMAAWEFSRDSAWHMIAATLDTYEATVRTVSEFERIFARAIWFGPLSSGVARCADLTRDIAAAQLSTARWILEM
jgi:hypothetical protein